MVLGIEVDVCPFCHRGIPGFRGAQARAGDPSANGDPRWGRACRQRVRRRAVGRGTARSAAREEGNPRSRMTDLSAQPPAAVPQDPGRARPYRRPAPPPRRSPGHERTFVTDVAMLAKRRSCRGAGFIRAGLHAARVWVTIAFPLSHPPHPRRPRHVWTPAVSVADRGDSRTGNWHRICRRNLGPGLRTRRQLSVDDSSDRTDLDFRRLIFARCWADIARGDSSAYICGRRRGVTHPYCRCGGRWADLLPSASWPIPSSA